MTAVSAVTGLAWSAGIAFTTGTGTVIAVLSGCALIGSLRRDIGTFAVAWGTGTFCMVAISRTAGLARRTSNRALVCSFGEHGHAHSNGCTEQIICSALSMLAFGVARTLVRSLSWNCLAVTSYALGVAFARRPGAITSAGKLGPGVSAGAAFGLPWIAVFHVLARTPGAVFSAVFGSTFRASRATVACVAVPCAGSSALALNAAVGTGGDCFCFGCACKDAAAIKTTHHTSSCKLHYLFSRTKGIAVYR